MTQKETDHFNGLIIGTGGRTRTGTPSRERDFKSLVSTNSTTPASLMVENAAVKNATFGKAPSVRFRCLREHESLELF